MKKIIFHFIVSKWKQIIIAYILMQLLFLVVFNLLEITSKEMIVEEVLLVSKYYVFFISMYLFLTFFEEKTPN